MKSTLLITSESRAFWIGTGTRQKDLISDPADFPNGGLVEDQKIIIGPQECQAPACELFHGPISEVCNFYEREKKEGRDIDLLILSSYYRAIQPTQEIVPYWTKDGKFHVREVPDSVEEAISSSEALIIALPSNHLELIRQDLAHSIEEKDLAVVSGKPSNGLPWFDGSEFYLPTKGVARIGSSNREKILKWMGEEGL